MALAELSFTSVVETSLIDWPGRMATVVFLPGCNFRCGYCHAKELVLGPSGEISPVPLADLFNFLTRQTGWVDGVVISGGEPTLYEELPDLARAIKKEGFAVKLDTNGTRPEVLASLIGDGLLDAVSMDIKAPLDSRYERVTRVEFDLEKIRESITLLMTSSIECEFRTTVAPPLLSSADVGEIAETIQGADLYTLQAFNPHACLDEKMESLPPCPLSLLKDAARLAEGFVQEVRIKP